MELNKAALEAANKGFKTAFNKSLEATTTHYQNIAMVVSSTNAAEVYPALKDMPGMREWVGERVIHSLDQGAFSIENKKYEHTYGVPRTAVEDDQLGLYSKAASDQGRAVKRHPDELVFGLLKNGHQTLCWDGQNFFDTDHPVLDENGEETSYSNYIDGAEDLWVLADNSREIKAVIYQDREKPSFTALDNPDDPNVFMKDEFLYGVRSRGNVGFGLPQLALASRQPLIAGNFEAAQLLGEDRKGDYGVPLDINFDTIYVTKKNKAAAMKLFGMKTLEGGGDNPNYKAVEVVVVSHLS